MAFCNNCGTQLQGDERFCVKCGHDVKANGATASAVVASVPVAAANAPTEPPQVVAPPPQSYPPPAPQGFAAPPPQGFVAPPLQGYAAPPVYPGQPPIIMGAPPTQSKRHGMVWVVVIIAVLYGLWYIGTHDKKPQPQPQTNPAQQPAQQPGGGTQPGGGNAALAQLQSFTGQVSNANGQVQISNGQWTNNATVAVQSVTLECIQYDGNGSQLAQTQNTLTAPNGPLQPQATATFSPFTMGAVAQGTTKANCGVVGAIPAN